MLGLHINAAIHLEDIKLACGAFSEDKFVGPLQFGGIYIVVVLVLKAPDFAIWNPEKVHESLVGTNVVLPTDKGLHDLVV